MNMKESSVRCRAGALLFSVVCAVAGLLPGRLAWGFGPEVHAAATWSTNLDVPPGTLLRVEAHIPGSSSASFRTHQAPYTIRGLAGANSSARVTIHQQYATSQWVSLGVFPFAGGPASVELVDETGEPTFSHVLVADAIRWVLP